MLPKFSTPTKPQYQTVDDISSKDASRSTLADDSMSMTYSSDNRDDSMSDIISATGRQFSMESEETREELEKDIDQPGSPVDCYGFPDNVDFPTNEWPENAGLPPSLPPPKKDTVAEAEDTVLPENEKFQNTEWKQYYSELPPPPPPSTKLPMPTLKSPNKVKSLAMKFEHSPPVGRVKLLAMKFEQKATDVDEAEATGVDGIECEAALVSSTETEKTVETKADTGSDDSSFIIGSPNTSINRGDPWGESLFMESVGNVTMDAFGFPLCEPTTPDTPPETSDTPPESVLPMSSRDSTAKAMRPSKSAPALNRLFAHVQVQAHYREPTDDSENEARDEPAPDPSLDLSQLESLSLDGATPSVAETKLNNAKALLTEAKAIVTDDDVDKMLLDHIEDPNKSSDPVVTSVDKSCDPAVTSVDVTNPVINTFFPKTIPSDPTPSVVTGSFDAEESAIEVLDSSVEIPMKVAKTHRRRVRIPTTKFLCSDDAMYCNINIREVEKAMWEFMDAFDESAGKLGYVIGCSERVPEEVNTSVNDTFSCLEDESLLNRMEADNSTSLLDSLTIDE